MVLNHYNGFSEQEANLLEEATKLLVKEVNYF